MNTPLIDLDKNIEPSWDEDVPRCSTDDCASYNGKRCGKLGHWPDGICEPVVVTIGQVLCNLRSEQLT
jgi:hypothetical protein